MSEENQSESEYVKYEHHWAPCIPHSNTHQSNFRVSFKSLTQQGLARSHQLLTRREILRGGQPMEHEYALSEDHRKTGKARDLGKTTMKSIEIFWTLFHHLILFTFCEEFSCRLVGIQDKEKCLKEIDAKKLEVNILRWPRLGVTTKQLQTEGIICASMKGLLHPKSHHWTFSLATSHDGFVLGSLVKGIFGILNIVNCNDLIMIYPDVQFVYRSLSFRTLSDFKGYYLVQQCLEHFEDFSLDLDVSSLGSHVLPAKCTRYCQLWQLGCTFNEECEEYWDGLFQIEPWLMYTLR